MPEDFDAARFDVPATFRNWNFAKNTIVLALLLLFLIWLNDASSWQLEELGIALVVGVAVFAFLEGLSWCFATLRVEWDSVAVGGVFIRRRVAWHEISSFSIMAPADRTPFMLAFWWWRDQARINLADGASHRVRAVEPRHGFTVLTYFAVTGVTDADRIVEALNGFLARRLTVDIDSPARDCRAAW